jgi:hypothetical protein
MKLNTFECGFMFFRYVGWLMKMYMWLKDNLPNDSVMKKHEVVHKNYANKNLRAFIISLTMIYFNQFNTK